jgi:ElaB/YqjD/DUF883 family membrane-anchored ribosome-binding protein
MSRNINTGGGGAEGQGSSRPTGGAGTTGTGTTGAGTSGAGTGATDAGTTRDTGMATTGPGGTGTATARSQEVGQKIADVATQAREYVTDKVGVVGDRLKDLQNVDINQMANQAKDYARQKPGQALLISAAAGFVIGLLLRGTRR